MYKCLLCQGEFKALTNTHLTYKHNLTIIDYLKKFPDEKIVVGREFIKGLNPWNKNLVFVKHTYYSEPGYYEELQKQILERDKNQCVKCGKSENLIVHHKIPVPQGKNTSTNLITVCRSCHRKLHSKKTEQFRFILEKRFDDIGCNHFLNNYEGLCKNSHGHNYSISVKVGGNELDSTGMLIDFSELKKIIEDSINSIDHQNLNDIFDFNPTAENMAWFLYYSLKGNIDGLLSVTVWETSNASATYSQYNNL